MNNPEKNPLVSIIIPVYKTELYLRYCIDSVINQTYENIELILVDDASPDSCPAICDQYASVDDRVVCIHKKNNEGVSEARNTAIDIAKGKFILFVDSDDYIRNDAVEILVNAATNNDLNCVFMNYSVVKEDGQFSDDIVDNEIKIESNAMVLKKILSEKIDSFLWQVLLPKEAFKNIVFPPDRVFEDLSVFVNIIDQCGPVGFVCKELYYYRYNRSGIVRSSNTLKKNFDYYLAEKERYEFAKRNIPDCEDVCFEKLLNTAISIIYWSLQNDEYKKDNYYIHEIENEIKNIQIRKLIRAHITLKYKVVALLYKWPITLKLFTICAKKTER